MGSRNDFILIWMVEHLLEHLKLEFESEEKAIREDCQIREEGWISEFISYTWLDIYLKVGDLIPSLVVSWV